MARFRFAAVVSPVSVIDSSKSEIFDILPDLGLTCILLKKILKIPLQSNRGELSSTASLQPVVRELGGGCRVISPPPASSARSTGEPRAARVRESISLGERCRQGNRFHLPCSSCSGSPSLCQPKPAAAAARWDLLPSAPSPVRPLCLTHPPGSRASPVS